MQEFVLACRIEGYNVREGGNISGICYAIVEPYMIYIPCKLFVEALPGSSLKNTDAFVHVYIELLINSNERLWLKLHQATP